MNNLILLTDKEGDKALVNTNKIITIERSKKESYSIIYLVDSNKLYVKETPEDIYSMVYKRV